MNTGRGVLTDKDLLIAMKVFHDGSGDGVDPTGDKWITLGAVAATDEVWGIFETRWREMLGARYPKAHYIHMIELLGHDDPFDRVNGWTLEKKQQLIADAIILLSQMNKQEFRWFRFSLNESAVYRLRAKNLPTPADLHKHVSVVMTAFTAGVYRDNCLHGNVTPENIFLFFDRGEKFMSGLNAEWLSKRTPPGQTPKPDNAAWDAIKNILPVDQAFAYPIQAADMVAWAHTRTLPTDEERPFSYLKDSLIKFVPSSQLDLTEQVIRQQGNLVYT